ncbi:hypothetical protein N0V90_004898 [Kalmusia sp. IMI 367209]|nr:hypothetical protein N0V90_004898 [Kalmusia sp. IMI 367209]
MKERKRGRARHRHRSQKAPQQDNVDEPFNEGVSFAEPTLAETNEIDVDDDDDDVDNDEVLDLIDEDEDDGGRNDAEDVEDKPKELSAKRKKRLERMANITAREAGPVILTLDVHDLVPISSEVTWDRDPELLCCYNWHGAVDGTNTIFVPGCPPKWTPPALPRTLETDLGYQYADYNYVRKPRDPYAPLFSALGVMNPNYQFWDIDILADRNNLRMLLEFVQGQANGPFRLDLHMVYNTLLLVRKGEGFWRKQDGSRNFGSNFEKVFTSPAEEMEDATSHYRAIRYPMGSLNVVVRFEADAYYDGVVASDELNPNEVDAVTGALLAERPRFDFRAPIRVLQKGHIIPTAQMAELKTQGYRPEHGMSNVACQDQLWFGRTRHLLTGRYQSDQGSKTGDIVRIKYEDAKNRVDAWENYNQENLRKLVDLLIRIRRVLSQQEGPLRAGVLVREGKDGPLVVKTMLKKHHIIGREFFTKHWERRLAGGPRGGGRGNRMPGGGLRNYHNQSGGMSSNNFHSRLGGYGGSNYRPRDGGYGEHDFQRRSGGYGGQSTQQQSGFTRGGGYRGRGRGRGRGYGARDEPNYGRLSHS